MCECWSVYVLCPALCDALFLPLCFRSTLNCVNTLGSKPMETEHAALIRELSGRAQQQCKTSSKTVATTA